MTILLDPTKASYLSASGLLWDLAGAWYLAKAFIFSKDDAIRAQSGTYYDLSVPVLRALCEQRLEAKFGVIHLFIGFGMQFLSAVGLTASFGMSAFLLLPIGFLRHWYGYNFDYWVATVAIRIGMNKPEVSDVFAHHFEHINRTAYSLALKRLVKTEFQPRFLPSILRIVDRFDRGALSDLNRSVNDLSAQAAGWTKIAADRNVLEALIEGVSHAKRDSTPGQGRRQQALTAFESELLRQLEVSFPLATDAHTR